MSSSTTFRLQDPIDLGMTLAPLRHGFGDPTIRIRGGEALRTSRTPDGPATVHLHARGGRVDAEAWGPGADWALQHAPELLGADDDPGALRTDHPIVGPLHRRTTGLRLCRSRAVVEALIPTIIEQKITSREARRSFRALVHRYGEPAPGPGGLKLQPSPERLAALPYWAFHPFGIERARADTLRRVCRVASRMEEAAGMGPRDAVRRIGLVTGVGPWTVAKVSGAALGDPDAVVVGDFHLPSMVVWVLAGESRADDERMLELLAQFEGQRGRVMRLIAVAGSRPPATINRRRIHHIAAH